MGRMKDLYIDFLNEQEQITPQDPASIREEWDRKKWPEEGPAKKEGKQSNAEKQTMPPQRGQANQ